MPEIWYNGSKPKQPNQKGIHTMTMLTQIPDDVQVCTTISAFMKRFEIGKLLKLCNAYKEKGVPAVKLFIFMLQKVFADRSMYMQMKTGRWTGYARILVFLAQADHGAERLGSGYDCHGQEVQ